MEKLIITGNQPLGGEISVHGSKNAVLPILAATLLIKGETVLHNVPDLSDVTASIEILRHLGAEVQREKHTLIINTSNIINNDIPEEMMREMRSSIIFLGSLVTRCKEALLCPPGGCDIGVRPIDLHLSSLKKWACRSAKTAAAYTAARSGFTAQRSFCHFQALGQRKIL